MIRSGTGELRTTFVGVGLMLAVQVSGVAADELDDLFSGKAADADRDERPPAEAPDGRDRGPAVETRAAPTTEPVDEGAGTSPAPAAAFGASASPRVIEEIVVTAQKTEQTLREIPASVSVLDGETIREAALVDVGSILQHAPNVKFAEGTPGLLQTVNIRGFGTPPLARNIEPSVGLVIDGIPYGRQTYASDAVFDLERLEVLRGPQGTLFGKNTVAGLLNFTTAEPGFEPTGYLNAAYGSLDDRRLEGALSFPILADVLAGRFAFRVRDRETGLDNTTLDETGKSEDIAGRLKLRWVLSDVMELDLSALHSRVDNDVFGLQLDRATERSLAEFREADPETETDAFDGRTSFNERTFSDRRVTALSGQLSRFLGSLFGLGDLEVALLGSWSRVDVPFQFDSDFSPIDFGVVRSEGPERYEQSTVELRATGAAPAPFGWGNGVELIAGVFAFSNTFDVTQFASQDLAGLVDFLEAGANVGGMVPLPPGGLPIEPGEVVDQEQFVHNKLRSSGLGGALFTQATWQLTDRLSLLGGIRVGLEDREGDLSSQGDSQIAQLFVGQENFDITIDRSESELTPRTAATWDVSGEVTVFASWARGFKSGGISGPLLAPRNVEYEPERADAWEIGAKTRLLDGSLVVDGALFWTDFEDLQVHAFDGTSFTTLNAATARARGFELDFRWLPPLPFLSLAGSAGYVDGRYVDYPCGPPLADDDDTSPECSDGPPLPPPPATQDLSGRPLAYTPKWSGSFSPSARFPLLPRFDVGALVGVDVLFEGSQFLDVDLDPNTKQDAVTRLNVRLGLATMDQTWALVANVRNLTGVKEHLVTIDHNQVVGNYVTAVIPDETLFTIDLRYRF